MGAYLSHMTSFLKLPDDVIQHGISPYLSCVDRTELNKSMPHSYRVALRIPKKKIIEFDILKARSTVYYFIRNMHGLVNVTDRRDCIINFFIHFKLYLPLFNYHLQFRNLFIEKLHEFTNPIKVEFDNRTPCFIKEVESISDAFYKETRYKYIGGVDCIRFRNGKLPSY